MTARVTIYTRISADRAGERAGVTRQREDCDRRAQERGWTVHAHREDNDITGKGTRHRAGFEALLDDITNGTVQVVLAWALDRIQRNKRDELRLYEACRTHGVTLSLVNGADLDFSTAAGRFVAEALGSVARMEIDLKSDRQKRANDQRAAAGLPFMGRRAFGYATGGLDLVDDEAAVFRAAVDQLLAGDTVRSITRMMNDAGATTTAGNRWRPTEVRRLLANPRHAGLRVHRGVVVGPGRWPAIIDEDAHAAVRAILDDPTRHAPGRPQGSLLTSIATCGICGQAIYATRSGTRNRMYYCRTRAHVSRVADPVDDYVTASVLALAAKHGPDVLARRSADPERVAQLRGREVEVRGRLDGLAQAYAAGAIDDLQLRAGSKRARDELEQVTADLAALTQTSVLSRMLAAPDLSEEWEALGLSLQRHLLSEVAVVKLHPVGRGARVFRPDTVEVRLG